jgi:hypothetical protein
MQVLQSAAFDILSSDFIFSVDPGIKNFSLTILIAENGILKVLDYYRIQLCSNKRPKVSSAIKASDTSDSNIYLDLYRQFNNIITPDYHHSKCTLVIERQLRSILLNRIEQHVISYFMLTLKVCNIFEVSTKNRIKLLKEYFYEGDSNAKITKKDSINFAIEKFKETGDIKGQNIIRSLKKKDDFADTICQVYAILDTSSLASFC